MIHPSFSRKSACPASRSEVLKVAAGFSPRVEFRKQPRRVATPEDRGCVRSASRGTLDWRFERGMNFQPNSGRQDARPLRQARRLPLRFSEEPYISSDLPANPKGIASSSPGLRGTSYPGSGVGQSPNPNGVASDKSRRRHNAVGVDSDSTKVSQGSSVRAGLANLATLGFGPESRWDSIPGRRHFGHENSPH